MRFDDLLFTLDVVCVICCLQRVKDGAPFSWSSLRPNAVLGFSYGSYMNLATTIAVYATLCKELGVPMR